MSTFTTRVTNCGRFDMYYGYGAVGLLVTIILILVLLRLLGVW
jgi:hypothetical protein